MQQTKLRVLTISKPYVSAAYREKFRILAKDPRFEIGLITPDRWDGQRYEPSDLDKFWMKQIPLVLNGKNHFFLFRGLKKAIMEFRPDVLNIEEEHYSAVTFQCYRLAVQMGIPPLFYTWQNIHKNYPFPFSAIERYIFKHTKIGIAGNEEAKEVLVKKGFTGRIAVIPQMGAQIPGQQGVESNLIKADWGSDRFVVTYAGRLVEEKGIGDFLRALSSLKGTRVLGLIIGSGPMEQSLKDQAHLLGIQEMVRFIGPVPSQDMSAYYQRSQALCLPSLTRANWKEQFGRVLVEAMASQVIPIGSDSGEIPLVIGDVGKIFPEGDSVGLAEKIKELMHLSNEELYALKERAVQRVRSHFSNDVIAGKFAEVFCEISNEKFC